MAGRIRLRSDPKEKNTVTLWGIAWKAILSEAVVTEGEALGMSLYDTCMKGSTSPLVKIRQGVVIIRTLPIICGAHQFHSFRTLPIICGAHQFHSFLPLSLLSSETLVNINSRQQKRLTLYSINITRIGQFIILHSPADIQIL